MWKCWSLPGVVLVVPCTRKAVAVEVPEGFDCSLLFR
jgi:hypothetical protein